MTLIVLTRVYDSRISSVYKCASSKNIILKILPLSGLKMKSKTWKYPFLQPLILGWSKFRSRFLPGYVNSIQGTPQGFKSKYKHTHFLKTGSLL